MNRLLVAILCAVALVSFVHSVAADHNSYQQTSQEQKDPKSYDAYVGQYEVNKDFILTITNEKGKLMGQPTGDEKVEFRAEKEPEQFFSSEVNARLKFVRNETNEVVGVIVTLDGKEFPAKKIK